MAYAMFFCALGSFAASSAEKIVGENPFLYSGYYIDIESDNGYLKARVRLNFDPSVIYG